MKNVDIIQLAFIRNLSDFHIRNEIIEHTINNKWGTKHMRYAQKTENSCLRRRGARRWLGRFAMSAALTVTMVGAALSQETYKPADPEPGTDIPSATVRMGILPYANASFPVIGIKEGFFSDVGITIPNGGVTVTEEQAHSLMVRGDIDVAHGYPPNFLPTYQNSRVVKQIGFHDSIAAGCMLASPEQNLKGFKDYFAEGKSFDEAIKSAMAPMQGKELASSSVPNERLFEETITQLTDVTFSPLILDDPNILVSAAAGKIQFAHPSGAPVVFSLLKSGWKPLVCLDDMIAHGPVNKDSPILRQISLVGPEANVNWINKNPNTVLRYLSAVWRTIDAIKADPKLYDIQAPVLNSITGTNLTGEDIAGTVKTFHPYIPYEENTRFYTDEKSPLYYKPIYEAIIKGFAEHGIVPSDVTPEDFVWGGTLWNQMEDYRKKTDKILSSVDENSLSDENKALVEKSRQFYGWHDYLDAYRFALAATK